MKVTLDVLDVMLIDEYVELPVEIADGDAPK